MVVLMVAFLCVEFFLMVRLIADVIELARLDRI